MKPSLTICFLLLIAANIHGQYWQQVADYQIDIRLDDKKQEVQGREKLTYYNNSPDTFKVVYLHLYWNELKPGSALAKWAFDHQERPVYDQLNRLSPDLQGKMTIFSVRQNSVAVAYTQTEGLLEITLNRPLMPNDYAVFDLAWQANIPVNVMGTGRSFGTDQPDYVFKNWYPAICPYDRYGWHFDQYDDWADGQEFGKYKVDITLPKNYMVAASGTLQNSNLIGMGYDAPGNTQKPNYGVPVNTWSFTGEFLQHFGWIADKQLQHLKTQTSDGTTVHIMGRPKFGQPLDSAWCMDLYADLCATTGAYPYKNLSIVANSYTSLDLPGIIQVNPTQVPPDLTTAVHWYLALTDNTIKKNALRDRAKWEALRKTVGTAALLKALLICRDEWQYERPLFDDVLGVLERVSRKNLDAY